MKKRDRITDLSVKAQIARTLQEKQVFLNDMLLEMAKGTRYEFDAKEVVEAYEKHYKISKKSGW
ncbi:hypothetical protein [Metabacillus fastidiosus]|uniref:Uncharacterized protein n=1 Tax=Metabacillus fastidiosus TaxID=1458 RepID=A0ABU6P4F0_9BACI|nr:hypothetical protein [Metabacillus fastidiosus]MED4404227.1 hypothetical protein [Metabacillus fastidiosus]